MSEDDKMDSLDGIHPCDIRFFRERAREERRRIRYADTGRGQRIHAEMAEHYEMVADLLEAKAGLVAPSLGWSLRRMLERLLR
ncbi:hypothetical protein [Sphingomonas sp.]|uniref:hypothetical protein n=1 Tax=Sphingomonas sp. TaxID=28214 RepID=UPI002ED7EDFC